LRGPQTTRVPSVVYETSWCRVQTFANTPPAKLPSRVIGLISRDLSAPFHLRSSVTRTSGVAASLGLSADSSVCLAARQREGREMRPTDVCFPTHSLRAPALRAFPARVVSRGRERHRKASPGKAAFHDAAYRFGGADDVGSWGVLFPTMPHPANASGTPVAPLDPARLRFSCALAELRRRAPRPPRPSSS
jgi:hypothetical protein